MAKTALDTFEYWLTMAPTAIEPHLPSLLPAFNDYLLVEHVDAASFGSSPQFRIIALLGKLGGNNIHLIGSINLVSSGTSLKCS